MLLELTPDMPDMLEEAKAWQPKDYKDHFQDSDFAEKDLACEAYGPRAGALSYPLRSDQAGSRPADLRGDRDGGEIPSPRAILTASRSS